MTVPQKRRIEFPRKLTSEQVAMILGIVRLDLQERRKAGFKRGTNGLTLRLAQEFRVTVWCIESIRKKRRWKHVSPKRL